MTVSLETAKSRQWERLSRAKVRDWPKLAEEDRQAFRMQMRYLDRVDQLAALDGSIDWAKDCQRDVRIGQQGTFFLDETEDRLALRAAGRFYKGPPQPVDSKALVIHIGKKVSRCGATTGKAAEDPSTVTLLVDRWCVRCWNRWAKERAA